VLKIGRYAGLNPKGSECDRWLYQHHHSLCGASSRLVAQVTRIEPASNVNPMVQARKRRHPNQHPSGPPKQRSGVEAVGRAVAVAAIMGVDVAEVSDLIK
jgi:hypothetical protein